MYTPAKASGLPANYHRIVSFEYLAPLKKSRDIETVNVHSHYLITTVEAANLSVFWHITASYATGNITQFEGSLNDGTFRSVQYNNTAFGIGPGLSAGLRLWSGIRVSMHLHGSGNFVVYSQKFPHGGDYYNFMWRLGPGFNYRINDSMTIGAGYRWAHISNAQGVGPENPSYDAEGISLRFTGFF